MSLACVNHELDIISKSYNNSNNNASNNHSNKHKIDTTWKPDSSTNANQLSPSSFESCDSKHPCSVAKHCKIEMNDEGVRLQSARGNSFAAARQNPCCVVCCPVLESNKCHEKEEKRWKWKENKQKSPQGVTVSTAL